MQIPEGMLDMFGEPTQSALDDTAELSVEVDVSEAERPSVPPPAAEPLLEVDPADRPTPPPREVWAAIDVDPADRPTPLPPLPRVPSPVPPPPPFGALTPRTTPAPAVPPPPPPPPPPAPPAVPDSSGGVVVMAPIRSVGEPMRVVIAEPPPPQEAPGVAPPPLLKPPRQSTQHGVGPAVAPLVDSLEWSGEVAAALPFDGALPGEPGVDGAERPPLAVDDAEADDAEDDAEDPEDDARDEDEDGEELAREPTQVRRTRDDGTPEELAAKSLAPASAPPVAPLPRPVTPAPAVPAPSTPVSVVPAAPPPPLGTITVVPEPPQGPVVREVEGESPREESDSDPGTPIDVETELLASPRAEPPPPPTTRTPSGPGMPAVVPPPPPPVALSVAGPGTPPPPAPGSPMMSSPLGGSVISVPPPVPVDARPDTGERRRKGKKWWEDFFNEEWLRTIPPVPAETTRKECDFIESSLGVERAASLLDLGCGTGRHAVELASRGYSVVALDLSLPMLDNAQRAADERETMVSFQQADIRDLSFESSFDAVYCLGTTLGLFDEDGNLQVIKNAHRALRENGTFLIEVVNRDHVLRGQPHLVWFEGDGCVCMEETNVNYITSRLQVKRTVMPDEGGQTETEYSVRLFSLHELGSLLHRHGFRVIEVSGHWSTRGVFFGADSQRLIVLAEKKEAGELNVPTGTPPGRADS
jgi:SAM-dependent methyltransferase